MERFMGFVRNGMYRVPFTLGAIVCLITLIVIRFNGIGTPTAMWLTGGALFMLGGAIKGYLGTLCPGHDVDDALVHRSANGARGYYLYPSPLSAEGKIQVTTHVYAMKIVLTTAVLLVLASCGTSFVKYTQWDNAQTEIKRSQPPYTAPYFVDDASPTDRVEALVVAGPFPITGSNLGLLKVRSEARDATWSVFVGMPCDLATGDNVTVRFIDYMTGAEANERFWNFDTLRILELPSGHSCTYTAPQPSN